MCRMLHSNAQQGAFLCLSPVTLRRRSVALIHSHDKFCKYSKTRMPTVRQRVERALRVQDIDGGSPLSAVPGVGTYLSSRAARALRITGRPATIRDLWMGTRQRVKARDFVRRIVQNERANQCVATRAANSRRRAYHTGDVNEYGYEAFATLLNYAKHRIHNDAAYANLPYRTPSRSDASKQCGCMSLRQCDASSHCTHSDDGRACVPAAHNTGGFEGMRAHTNQRETHTDAARVRSASHTRVTQAHRNDPDVHRDLRRRRSRTLSYARRGSRLWRRPGSRVRVPV